MVDSDTTFHMIKCGDDSVILIRNFLIFWKVIMFYSSLQLDALLQNTICNNIISWNLPTQAPNQGGERTIVVHRHFKDTWIGQASPGISLITIALEYDNSAYCTQVPIS